jgi:carnitine 3-dehydrogenase
MLLHMDLNLRKTSLPDPHVAENLAGFAAKHAALPTPDGKGRAIG